MKGATTRTRLPAYTKPDGTTPYTLPVNRLEMLYNAYSYARDSNPTAHNNMSAGTFEGDVYQLLTRYKDGALCAATTSSTITAEGSAPPPTHFSKLSKMLSQQTRSDAAAPLTSM
jgi:hypothetical protein